MRLVVGIGPMPRMAKTTSARAVTILAFIDKLHPQVA